MPDRSRVVESALRTSRTTSEPRTATTIAAMKPLTWAEAHLLRQPAADHATEDADDDVRQAAPGRPPPTSAPEMAPAMRPTTIQPRMSMSSIGRVSHGRERRLSEERATRLDDRVGMGVVGGVAGAGDDDDPAVGEARVERPVASREGRQAVAAEQLEDRLADATERARAPAVAPASTRSSRAIVGAAATRSGQTGSAR